MEKNIIYTAIGITLFIMLLIFGTIEGTKQDNGRLQICKNLNFSGIENKGYPFLEKKWHCFNLEVLSDGTHIKNYSEGTINTK